MAPKNFSQAKYEIVIFDCDSTLAKIEGINELARVKGKAKEVLLLTRKAMNGELKFEEVLLQRLELIRPCQKDLEWLGQKYLKNAVKGAKEVISQLRQAGVQTYLVTGAYGQAVSLFAQDLGFPKENVFAIDLKFDREGNYAGYDEKNPLTQKNGKRKIVQEIAGRGKTVFVGDGANDLEVKEAVDLFVGFGGVVVRPIVKENADVFITEKTLLPILDLIFENSN